jgi:hypothetical protein
VPDFRSAEFATALFTAVIAFATIWLARNTVRAATVTMQADLLERLIARWDSAPMRSRRAVLARSLRERRKVEIGAIPGSKDKVVVEFFEEVGLCVAKKLLNKDLVWEIFFDYAMLYWELCGREFADKMRTEENRTQFAYFERMVVEMKKVYYRKTKVPKGTSIHDESDIDDFLLGELNQEA